MASRCVRWSVASVSWLVCGVAFGAPHPHQAKRSADPGFLLVAPDRGFLGNEEVGEVFESFAANRNAALVFVTDERTRATLDGGLSQVKKAGARRVVVLPFFLSKSDPGYQRVQSLLGEGSVAWARPFGESYFAVERLAEELRRIPSRTGRRLIVVGTGGADQDGHRRAALDLRRIAEKAAEGLGFESVREVVSHGGRDSSLRGRLAQAMAGAPKPIIAAFSLGKKLDGMMSFVSSVQAALPKGTESVAVEITPHPSVATWLIREANRAVPPRPAETGVVVLAHGSDYHWNEAMRAAAAPLGGRYLVEPSFSMADRDVLARSIARLEQRGARAIVIVRVFALAESFREDVERFIGVDAERGDPPQAHAGHGHGHGHGGAGETPPARILSSAVLSTAGGLEDSPLFADALLDRVKGLSREPSEETVILVGHGAYTDKADQHWRRVLQSIAEHMKSRGGSAFRAIQVGTWREDWPDKRKVAAEEIRGLVQKASTGGGRALIIPARTLGQGPERELLSGLSYELGAGFVPHPLFTRWLEEQVRAGLSAPAPAKPAPAGPARAEAGHAHQH